MANYCLMPELAQRFKTGLKSGEIDPNKLAKMSSEERSHFLGQFVGDNNAQAVNALFESKLLLKNQKRGMITWAKQVSGISPATRRDIVAKIERMQEVLDPAEEKQFLKDLTAQRLGVGVSREEAKTIADLSKKVTQLDSKRLEDNTFPTKDDRLAYGRAVEDLTHYVSELKQNADKLRISDIKNPGTFLGKATSRGAGNLKSMSASMDNSAIFRQGWKTLITNPGVWAKNAPKTFIDLLGKHSGKDVLREVNADIISRPTYDKMVKAKLAIKNPEEAFPESLSEKIPALGRLYKRSEAAYTGFVYKQRADVFDKYLDIAKKSGVDIENPKELQAIGKVVNSLTGRGSLGPLEPVGNVVNNVFFSPRFLKSNIDTLTAHALSKDMTPFARKQAATNLLKIISGVAAILVIADNVLPGSVEKDPRSSDFGKIRVGDTRFDVTGGMGSIVVLASRLATAKSKSSTTGKITDLNSGDYGAPDQMDTVYSFFENKLSPAAQLAKGLKTGKDNLDNKTTPGKLLGKAVTPLGIQSTTEAAKNPQSAGWLATAIADGVGISANTYSPAGDGGVTTWSQSKSKKLDAFKQKVGEQKFTQASQEYDKRYNKWIDTVTKIPVYKELPDDQKTSLITKKKAELQKQILESYNFKYKAPKKGTSKTTKSLLKQ